MKLRLILSAVGFLIVLASLTPLFAQPKAASAVCCGTYSDCHTGEVCCPSDQLGWGDCDNSVGAPGYCMSQCPD